MMSDINGAVGKHLTTTGGKIAGVVVCLPTHQVANNYFEDKFGVESVKNVVKMIGVEQRRWANASISTADLCYQAATHLLKGLDWQKESIDALIFVSQTPDYRLPATACALHGRLDLAPACLAFDINLGCSAYPYALWLGMNMIQTGAADRVLLAVGDTVSRAVDPNDRSTAMLFGDAGTVTALERCENSSGNASFILGTDGKGAHNLIIPRGAYKDYSLLKDERIADKDPDCLFMDGSEIFNFTLQVVPALVAATIGASGQQVEDFDAFLFHQANSFMLKHLIKKVKLPIDKVPININRFGNTSSASIPLLMADKLADPLRDSSMNLAMFGFGVGYSWASATLQVGSIDVIDIIEFTSEDERC
jgi:3-oxoacyl-[acyl-carrier-protein] synthase III